MARWRMINLVGLSVLALAPTFAFGAPGRGHGERGLRHRHGVHRHYGSVRHGHASPWRRMSGHRHWHRPGIWAWGYSYPRWHYGFGTYPIYAGGYYDFGDYQRARPSYAGSGLLLGALAGGIIGHNSGDLHHSAWGGAALAATAGYLLGSAAEQRARAREFDEAARAQAAAVTAVRAPVAGGSASAAPSERSGTTTTEVRAAVSSLEAANRMFGR